MTQLLIRRQASSYPPKAYPTPEMIADAWQRNRNNNVKYFWNNVSDGIRTFEDDAIRERLEG